MKKKKKRGLIKHCHRISRCRAGCKCNLFMCWRKYFSGCLPPYWRKRTRKERKREEKRDGGRVYSSSYWISTQNSSRQNENGCEEPGSNSMFSEKTKRAWKTTETLMPIVAFFWSWKRIYDARFWLFLNTHTWLNTNEINFTAAIFPHLAHGDLLKETPSRGVKKEHKT